MTVFNAAVTAVFGVTIFVLGQFIQRLIIEPVQEQRRTKGKVAHALTYYRNVMPKGTLETPLQTYSFGAEPEEIHEARKALRALASELRSTRTVIPFYRALSALRLVEPPPAVEKAASGLVGWSNSLSSGRDNEEYCRSIETALRLPRA